MQDRESATRFTFKALLIAVVVFAGVAPTLSWLEFSSGSENLIVGTILEMRRGGPWLVPNLNGQPRTSKPPMVNWISATVVRPETVEALSDNSKRDAAYRELSWEIRWPALAFTCCGLIAAAWLGRAIFGDAAGLTTAAVMASSILFLRFGRTLSTDVQLMLWVTTANALFALAILDGRRWLGCIGGGLALGLAMMSKGPVSLVQTVAPIALFVAWRKWRGCNDRPVGWLPVFAALLAGLLVALPWPIVVLSRMSGQVAFWYREITQGGNIDYRPDPPWVYLSLVPLLIPWIGFFIIGLVILAREKTERGMLVLFLLVTPILIMCCFKEKNDRYLLPMLAPAAMVCAAGFLRRGKEIDPTHRVVAALTWGLLAAMAAGVPIAGTFMTRLNGSGWWSWKAGAPLGAIALIAVLALWRFDPGGRRVLLPAAVVIMVYLQALFTYGYGQSARGLSDGRPVSDKICAALPPNAEVWSYSERGRFSRVPIDTVIYLNRLVRPATQPTTLPTDSTPRAMLVHFRGNETLPAGLEHWRLLGSGEKNEGTWRAYAQPAAPTRQ